jgi:aspartate racemase
VCLQPNGSSPPLFLIHAGAGYVFFYRALASRLAPDRPVYGIRAASKSDAPARPFDRNTSVEELAAQYIAEMRAVQPKGPYSVGGACFGGVIAFEMARQLCALGEEAGPVLLFDAFVLNNPYGPPVKLDHRGHEEASFWQRIAIHLNHAARLEPAQATRYLSRKTIGVARSQIAGLGSTIRGHLRAAAAELDWIGSKARGIPPEALQRHAMEDFLESSLHLLCRYTPDVYEGRIVLFKAADMEPDAEPFWTGLAQGGMPVHRMPGGHLDMLEEPAVTDTAALVRQYLDEPVTIPAAPKASVASVVN